MLRLMTTYSISDVLLVFFICFAALTILRLVLSTRRSSSLPPGPPTLPILGNLHQIPKAKGFLKFQQWAKEYGPIISLKTGTKNLVILNKAEAVRDLFDKRGAIYSSRPANHIGTELITRDNTHLLLMPYGIEWRQQRKIFQAVLNITAVGSLRLLQEAEAALTLQQLAQSPQLYYDHIRRYSTAVILSSVFGIRGPEFRHPNVQRLYHVQDQFTAILETGATPPVDVFPLLKYLPTALAPWRQWALKIRQEQRELYLGLLQSVKDRRARGIKRNCFMDQILEESFKEKYSLDDEHIAYIGGVMMEGGSDTTASTLFSFLLAMAKYPHVLRKAQDAVDAVCGSQRSPDFEDLKELPYIKHCIFEVLRWRPVAAGGLPHTLIQDDYYEGYHFPAGTTFLANTWAIHHDTEYFDRPDEFIPERFEGNEYGLRQDSDPIEGFRKTYGFGAGRRICPGSHLAENSLHINIAKIVWAFDISPGKDEVTQRQLKHSEVKDSVQTEWTNGFLTAPKPFPLTLVPRSEQHRKLIDQEVLDFGKIFQSYEN